MTESRERGHPITVLTSSDPAVLAVAKSLLEAAKIPFFAKGEAVQDLFAGGRFGTGFNPVVGPIELQVAAEDADEAKALLGELRK